VIIAHRNKSDFSFLIPTLAVSVTLLAFAAEYRAVTSAVAPLAVHARHSAANRPHVTSGLQSHDGTDRQTDIRNIMSQALLIL